MAGPRKNKEHKIALFPFLSVLICTIGVLTLILISSVLGQVDAVVDTAEKYKGIVRELGDINRQVHMLEGPVDRQRERARNLKVELDRAEQLLGELGRIDEGKHRGMYHALTNALKKTRDAEDDTQNIRIKIKTEDPTGEYAGNATADAINKLAGLKKTLNAVNLEKDDIEAKIGKRNREKKGIEEEIAEAKKKLEDEDKTGELRKTSVASREKLEQTEDDLKETNAEIKKLMADIPEKEEKLQAAKVKLAGLPKENLFSGGTVEGFEARYAECTRNWVQLDPGRKGGGGALLNLANENDQNKFKAFLREINKNGEKLVLLIRPSGVGRIDSSGVENYYLARQIAKDLGLAPGHLALREGVKIQFGDKKED